MVVFPLETFKVARTNIWSLFQWRVWIIVWWWSTKTFHFIVLKLIINLFYSQNFHLIWLNWFVFIVIFVKVVFNCSINRIRLFSECWYLEINIQDFVIAKLCNLLAAFCANATKMWSITRSWLIVEVILCYIWKLQPSIAFVLRFWQKCLVILCKVFGLTKRFNQASSTSLPSSISMALCLSLYFWLSFFPHEVRVVIMVDNVWLIKMLVNINHWPNRSRHIRHIRLWVHKFISFLPKRCVLPKFSLA